MNPIPDFRKVPAFLGRRTMRYLAFGLANGLALFAVEFCFAYGLQAFLLVIGVLSRDAARLPSWIPRADLASVLAFVTGIGAFRGLLQWVQVYLSQAVSGSQKLEQRGRVVDWVFQSQSVSSGEAMTLLNDHVEAVGDSLMNAHQALVSLVTSALLLAYLFRLAPVPTLIATATVAVIAYLASRLDRRISTIGSAAMGEARLVHSGIIASIRNLILIQIYGTQEREAGKIHGSLERSFGHLMRFTRILGVKFILPQMVGVILISVITYVAIRGDGMAPSLLVTYFYLFVRLAQLLTEVSSNVTNMVFHWPRVSHLFRWWDRQRPAQGGVPGPGSKKDGAAFDAPVGWVLRRAGYAYPESRGKVINDLDLTVRPRETLVVTGASGAGKSTLIFLMLGLVRPIEGDVALLEPGGRELPLESARARLLASVGYVGPESFLVEGSVRANLLYGLQRLPSDEELWSAIGKAECQFVSELPKGLEHPLTEQGQGLSAGQKQRISLARALLRRPTVLILDEATANLDIETEARLVETLRRLKSEMTIVAATHRQALLSMADHHLELPLARESR